MKPNNDGEPRKRSRLTRQACDSCAKKKRQCTGDTPCQRCKRTGIECIYSVKAIGRKRPGDGGEGGKKVSSRTKSAPPASPSPASSTTTFASATALPGPATQVSCGTGLGGLDESRYLSIFLVECCPMYPCADDASIRDGLMHEFVGLANRDSQEALQGAEAMRGQALSCSLFSCVALGGLISGCPPAAVAPHMTTARACVAKFGGLSDRYAVSALILYAMASEYVGGQGPGTEYAKGMEAARAIFEGLPAKDKDPVLSAVLAHFMVLEGLPLLRLVETNAPTTNPAHRCNSGGVGGGMGGAPVGWSTGGSNRAPLGSGGVHHGGGGGGGGRERNSGTSYVCCNTAHEEATFQRALAIRADVNMVSSQNPPPVYVVADAQLLTIRFSRDRGDVATRLWHLHDFATSELRRFRQEGKGAVALLALIGPLIGVQIRLGRLDGILATAELASSLIRKCPGLVRIYHRHVAHLSMAVFRLYGRRDAYDALRNLLAKTIQQDTPAFEDMSPSTSRFCDLPMCASHLRKLLKMRAPRPADGSGGGGGTATTGVGSSGGHNDSSGSYPVMSAAHGGVGSGAGAGAAPRQRSEGDFLVPPSAPPFRDRGQQVEQLTRRRYSQGVGTAVADVRPGLPLPAAGWSYLDYNKGAVSRPPSASASASASAAPRTAPHEASGSSFHRPPLPPFGALPPLPPPSQPQPQQGGGAEGLGGAPVPAPAASSYELGAATAYGGATAVGSAAASASELFDTVGFEEAARRDQTAASAPAWGTVSPAWGGGRFQSPAAGERLRRGGDAGGGGGGSGGGGGPWGLSTHGGKGQHGRDGRGLAPGAPPPSSAAHVTTSGAELSSAHGQKNVDHQSAITAADLQSVSHAMAGADGDTSSSANAGRPQLPDL